MKKGLTKQIQSVIIMAKYGATNSFRSRKEDTDDVTEKVLVEYQYVRYAAL